MDTTTHITTGICLAGLSFIDPTVSNHPEILAGMMICTIVGSNAPDIDFLYKYKGNEEYVKEHRGMTHSIPALFILSISIAFLVSLLYGGSYLFTFFLWTSVSVMIHVLLDVCNIYGTQALRPFSTKWLALNILPIFDPVIMALQVVGIFLWMSGFQASLTFVSIFGLMIAYIVFRLFVAKKVIHEVKKIDRNENELYTLIPSFSLFSWTVIASCEEHYRLGKYRKGKVIWFKVLSKTGEDHQIINAAKRHRFVHHLLQYSPFIHTKIVKIDDGYEVHWFDLRYQSRIDEPFIAIIRLDKKLNLVKSSVKRGLISIPEKI